MHLLKKRERIRRKKSVNAEFNWHIFFVISCAIAARSCVIWHTVEDRGALAFARTKRERMKTPKKNNELLNPANYRVIKYILVAYLARKSRRKPFACITNAWNWSHCERNRERCEWVLGIASAITNFRIMCTTFIIIDLREFLSFGGGTDDVDFGVLCETKRKAGKKSEQNDARHSKT